MGILHRIDITIKLIMFFNYLLKIYLMITRRTIAGKTKKHTWNPCHGIFISRLTFYVFHKTGLLGISYKHDIAINDRLRNN